MIDSELVLEIDLVGVTSLLGMDLDGVTSPLGMDLDGVMSPVGNGFDCVTSWTSDGLVTTALGRGIEEFGLHDECKEEPVVS